MKPEQVDVQPDDFAEVWKAAHQQRSEDLNLWLKQLFRRRLEADRPAPVASPSGRILAAG
jgi:lipopolysaccharide biosynthesis regulator YciM